MARKPKEPIRLRRKRLKNGSESLYLDCWQDGRRTYEFLKLYIIPEKTRLDKERNKTTLLQAERRKTERILQLQQGRYGLSSRFNARSGVMLSEVVESAGATKKAGTREKYYKLADYVRRYGDVRVSGVDKAYIVGFLAFLSTLRGNAGNMLDQTRQNYLFNLRCSLGGAVRSGMIDRNPCDQLTREERPRPKPRQICYLTIEEVSRLAATPCKDDEIKRAFLFACFTGLRYSDVKALQWSDIQNGFVRIRQRKTGDIVGIPLSENARRWLPEKSSGLVFSLPAGAGWFRRHLTAWAKDAGIDKPVTFHVSRHTAATLWLTYGVDLYTCSRLLGHKSISVTQIYAQVVDKKKIDAVNAVPELD